MAKGAFIPYGMYWSSPFVRWQGALANQHPLRLAASCASSRMAERGLDPQQLSSLILGFTVPSVSSFYGAPWVANMLGAPHITGPTIMQACATSARCLASAAEMAQGDNELALIVSADRTSNGPHLYYPNPDAPGGRGQAEDWVWDNFSRDPVAKNAMVQTAENVASEEGISREAQDALTLVRYEQYRAALADDAAFQRRYMLRPLELRNASGRKVVAIVEGDEGIHPTSAEGLAGLRSVVPDGTVTFGTQTHPADGNAGMLVTGEGRARSLSTDPEIRIRIASFAQANAAKGFMAKAVLPAAQKALEAAGFSASEVCIKTHNPFAVNDIYLARELGVTAESFNNFGSSLIYGHPQAPTGLRLIIELIEELVLEGGGRGLFAGCAAGDTAAAVCIEVG